MPFMQIGDKMRIGYDPSTGERGTQIRLVNKTGAASVKGSVVRSDVAVAQAASLVPADSFSPAAIVYEAGIADGAEMWCWVPGSFCQVLLEDASAATVGYWVKVSDTQAGRADATNATPPGGTITALEDHSSELGHAAESQAAGTDVLCLIHFHVN